MCNAKSISGLSRERFDLRSGNYLVGFLRFVSHFVLVHGKTQVKDYPIKLSLNTFNG